MDWGFEKTNRGGTKETETDTFCLLSNVDFLHEAFSACLHPRTSHHLSSHDRHRLCRGVPCGIFLGFALFLFSFAFGFVAFLLAFR